VVASTWASSGLSLVPVMSPQRNTSWVALNEREQLMQKIALSWLPG
jgi:hypothetical protein